MRPLASVKPAVVRGAVVIATIAACSGGQRPSKKAQTAAPTTSVNTAASSAPPRVAVARGLDSTRRPAKIDLALGSPSAAPATTAPAQTTAEPAACPNDMVLVDGQYCTDLEVRCKTKWHAPQNKLWVCEEVERNTRCVGQNKTMRYCIDRYEFPNRKGVRPMVMQNFYQAQLHCAKRGKRMCTESEWTKACEGPDNKPFPYGYVRDATKCHGDQRYAFPKRDLILRRDAGELERLWQGVVSGSQPDCVSDYGVYDMPANADELAASESYGRGPKSNFDNVTTGGPWYKGVRNMCRPKI
ncbi:MAG: SUMF1/EgtB/PvdO family nonheme iron enzyme, partial [Polyangiaceae bacterium]